jgi:hypothetical protein
MACFNTFLQPKRVTVFPFGKFDKILEFEFDWRQVFSSGGIQSKPTIKIIKYEQKVAKIPRHIHNETQHTLEETESNIHKHCKVYFSQIQRSEQSFVKNYSKLQLSE